MTTPPQQQQTTPQQPIQSIQGIMQTLMSYLLNGSMLLERFTQQNTNASL